jgi:crotonobetainyl-CoA:carnitine CoA-transferase CaiB-like acyl-CoA transferase
MAVSIYHKLKTGEATRSRTSLSAITNLAQLPFAFDYQGRAPFNEPSGREVLGHNALSHFYETSEGWIYIDSKESELTRLEQIEGFTGISSASNIGEFLRNVMKTAPAAYWARKLQAADIAVAVPMSIEALRAQYSREADGTVGIDKGSFAFSIHRNHPSGHRLTQIDHLAIRPSEASIQTVSLPERWGHSTREVLAEAGYDATQVNSMIERNIASLGWAKEFLPS